MLRTRPKSGLVDSLAELLGTLPHRLSALFEFDGRCEAAYRDEPEADELGPPNEDIDPDRAIAAAGLHNSLSAARVWLGLEGDATEVILPAISKPGSQPALAATTEAA